MTHNVSTDSTVIFWRILQKAIENHEKCLANLAEAIGQIEKAYSFTASRGWVARKYLQRLSIIRKGGKDVLHTR